MCAHAYIEPGYLRGTLNVPASKSEAHRALICAAFAKGVSHISLHELNEDILATKEMLEGLGTRIEFDNLGLTVYPAQAPYPHKPILSAGESGSTLRFMLPVIAALGCGATINLYGRLPKRPLEDLVLELSKHGVSICGSGTNTLSVEGTLRGGHFSLPGDVSSQFVSGLLLAATLTNDNCTIEVKEPIQSKPYIELTKATLAAFGITVAEHTLTTNGHQCLVYGVESNQHYMPVSDFAVRGDWSNAAFWLAAAALGNNGIELTGLDLESSQGDKEIINILRRMGGCVICHDGLVTLDAFELKPITVDVSDYPDLVPPIAAVFALTPGTSTIVGAERLRLKESDRLKSVSAALQALGARVVVQDDGLIVEGTSGLQGGRVDAAGDHRIAMMAAILATRCTSSVSIYGAECVRKSYPTFFEDFQALGGRVSSRED